MILLWLNEKTYQRVKKSSPDWDLCPLSQHEGFFYKSHAWRIRLRTYSPKTLIPEMHHANISQKHFSNFACIFHPNTFPEKANPFSQFILEFGGVPTLQHLQSISMNVFRPMCHNFTHSWKYKVFGGVNHTLEVLTWVFGGVFDKRVRPLKCQCQQLCPLTPTLSSGLLTSVLPLVANQRLNRGSPLHPPVLLWRYVGTVIRNDS